MASVYAIVWRTLILMSIFSSLELISGQPIGESISKIGGNNDVIRWTNKLGMSLFDRLRYDTTVILDFECKESGYCSTPTVLNYFLQNYNKRSLPVYFLDDNASYNAKRDNEPTLKGKFKNCYFSIVQCIIPSWLRRK